MNEPPEYEAWITRQRVGQVPVGFGDRVMASLQPAPSDRWAPPLWQAAAWTAAVLVLALRVGGALAVLWPQ